MKVLIGRGIAAARLKASASNVLSGCIEPDGGGEGKEPARGACGAEVRGLSKVTRKSRKDGFGLVLGGGGARGLAHIGVLKVLEREGLAPQMIVGTSMGAIVGGMYAQQPSAKAIEERISE